MRVKITMKSKLQVYINLNKLVMQAKTLSFFEAVDVLLKVAILSSGVVFGVGIPALVLAVVARSMGLI